jgi:hypothetical protein
MERLWFRNVSLLGIGVVVVVMATIGLGEEVAAKEEVVEKEEVVVEVVVVGVEGDRPFNLQVAGELIPST